MNKQLWAEGTRGRSEVTRCPLTRWRLRVRAGKLARMGWGGLTAIVAAGIAAAQCPMEWAGGFAVNGLAWGAVLTLGVYDDGRGPGLYAGGGFLQAGGQPIKSLARWDGHAWSAVGEGLEGWPSYNPFADALGVYDSGAGPELVVGGSFRKAGGLTCANIARWNGTRWTTLGDGIGDRSARVQAIAVYDDGSGPALYAGGCFATAGSIPAHSIARWDGALWSGVGGGVEGTIDDMAVFDDGTGPALYVAGSIESAGGVPLRGVGRWNGTAWSGLGPDAPYRAAALAVYDDGRGNALYIGHGVDGVTVGQILSRWDGATWHRFGPVLTSGVAKDLHVWDDGRGPALYIAVGSYSYVHVPGLLASWSNAGWLWLGPAQTGYSIALADALCPFDDGSGVGLYVGGSFNYAGATPSINIARWECVPGGRSGDLNCDGRVDLADIDPFVLALSDPADYTAQFPSCLWINTDCNGDGRVDFGDITPFVDLLSH